MSALSAAIGPYVTTANVLWFAAALFGWGLLCMRLIGGVKVNDRAFQRTQALENLHQRATRRQQEQEKV